MSAFATAPDLLPANTEQRCFLPDVYAITWAWNGAGDIMSYDPTTGVWTDYGKTAVPDGTVVGGFSMDINNNTNNPLVVYQVGGTLYTAPLNDPTSMTLVGSSGNSAFAGSYPCGAFRPGTEEYWLGIGSGSTVGVADLSTGAVTTLGTLVDVRDGAPLSAGPGDWFFDPEGNLFLMARDIRGATFGQSTGTVLWQIDPNTLEVTRIGETSAPSSGTGASWQAAGTYLLSTGPRIYTYRPALDPAPGSPGAWVQEIPNAPHSINDLGNQWVVPEVEEWTICYEKDKNGDRVSGSEKYYRIRQDDADPNRHITVEGPPNIPGTWDKCDKVGSAFVTDPVSPSGSEAKPTDKVWQEGCADQGVVLWREDCDGAREYIYGAAGVPSSVPPDGFLPYACGSITVQTETLPFCVYDGDPNAGGQPEQTVYRQQVQPDGPFEWFDETGTIAPPAFALPGECPPTDENTIVSEQVVCWQASGEDSEATHIRRYVSFLAPNGDGLLEETEYQVLVYNQDGTKYNSGVLATGTTDPSPSDYYLGECVESFLTTERDIFCEIPAKFLLLIDSGGGFARYSFLSKTWTNVSTLSVASAGGSADVVNRVLYNFVSPDQITRVDVNTDTQLPNMTVIDGVLKPGLTENPKTFSAASFRSADGKLYAQETGGADAGLYCVNVSSDPSVTTATVDFVANISGVFGFGTSMMIDNSTDTLIVNGSNLSYDVDWVTGVGTPWGNPPIQPNGGTFDTEGNAYVTQALNTFCLPAGSDPNDSGAWVNIIDDWGPGANSLAYYEVDTPEPPEFECRYGVRADGSRALLGTYETVCGNENVPRTIVGEVVPCSYAERQKLEEQCELLRQIAANTAPDATYGGPTAAEIAEATVSAQRDVTPGVFTWVNNGNTVQLPVAAGTRGRIVAIEDFGTGFVRWSVDGSEPATATGAAFTTTGPYHAAYALENIDLSQVRLNASSGNSDFSVAWEAYN